MRELGLLGENILGSRFQLRHQDQGGRGRVRLRRGDGAHRLDRGEAGHAPDASALPGASGLWGKPTIINNVETLGTLPNIIRNGAEWYAGYGTETIQGNQDLLPRREESGGRG